MKIQRTVKLSEEVYKWLEEQAEENCRSFAAQIEYLAKQEMKKEKAAE